jgi:hypothetical protein
MTDALTRRWTYRSDLDTSSGDVTGYDVEATDGSIGKIDEASTDAGASWLVVDTGFWIFGKKRLIPAGAVTRVDHDLRQVHVSMTKDQIKAAPDYDADVADFRDESRRRDYDYYDPYLD